MSDETVIAKGGERGLIEVHLRPELARRGDGVLVVASAVHRNMDRAPALVACGAHGTVTVTMAASAASHAGAPVSPESGSSPSLQRLAEIGKKRRDYMRVYMREHRRGIRRKKEGF